MSIYIVGDLHLSKSDNIEKPMSVFGYNWDNHDEKIENDWLRRVNESDTVILAGDISWAMKLEDVKADFDWLSTLPGKKVMIKGNHDYWWQSLSKMKKAFPDAEFLQNSYYNVGDVAICGSRGWICPGTDGFKESDKKIYNRELLRMETSLKQATLSAANEIIAVMHYPPTNEKKYPSGFTELFEQYSVKNVYYGHLHGKNNFFRSLEGVFNGIEYKLISIDKLNFKLWKIR